MHLTRDRVVEELLRYNPGMVFALLQPSGYEATPITFGGDIVIDKSFSEDTARRHLGIQIKGLSIHLHEAFVPITSFSFELPYVDHITSNSAYTTSITGKVWMLPGTVVPWSLVVPRDPRFKGEDYNC